jgi:hypothetical protein
MGAGKVVWGGGAWVPARAISACRLGFISILTGGGAGVGAGGWQAGGVGLGRLRMVMMGMEFNTGSNCRQSGEQM